MHVPNFILQKLCRGTYTAASLFDCRPSPVYHTESAVFLCVNLQHDRCDAARCTTASAKAKICLRNQDYTAIAIARSLRNRYVNSSKLTSVTPDVVNSSHQQPARSAAVCSRTRTQIGKRTFFNPLSSCIEQFACYYWLSCCFPDISH